MGPLVVLLLAALQPLSALDWDQAVSSEGRLDLLHYGQSVLTLTFEELHEARGLVYLPKRDIFLFSNSQEGVETAIYALKINTTHINSSTITPLIKVDAGASKKSIISIAHDPVKDEIYWSDWRKKTIFKAAVGDALERKLTAQAKVWRHFDSQYPMYIAVDYCKRHLYWTNRDSTVERSNLDGSELKKICSESTSPMGLALDLKNRWVYWLDDWDGNLFSVEASAMDQSEKRTVLKDTHHQPLSLTFNQDSLLWTDRQSQVVWSMHLGEGHLTPFKYFGTENKDPFNIVVKPLSLDYKAVCLPDQHTETTTVVPTLTPSQIQLMCANFCLHGTCNVINRIAVCQCPLDRSGNRCEIDLCQGMCLNDGHCQVNPTTKAAVCHCSQDFEGKRCEFPKGFCSSLSDALPCTNCSCSANDSVAPSLPLKSSVVSIALDDPVIITLGSFCCVLVLVAIYLSLKVLQLSRRPRLKRRVIVSRREVNVPSFDQPPASAGGQAPGSDTCEIMIENCCNMNICETPCFEPPNRLGRKMKKEDKKTLLANMDDSDVEELEPSHS